MVKESTLSLRSWITNRYTEICEGEFTGPKAQSDSGRFSVFTGTFQDISAGRGHYKGKKAEVVPC